MALAPRRRARRLWDYLRSERRTLRQGFAALLGGTVTALVAGVTLASITSTLNRLPGLLILIPAILGMRGTIFGAMGARLGTATHAGLFEVTRDRAGILYQNVYVAIVSTLFSSLYLAALAKLSALAFGLRSIPFFDLVTIAVVGGILDSAIILALTVGLSILSYRRGYDLDTVATPLITAAADMITIPTLYLATLLTTLRTFSTGLGIAGVFLCIYAMMHGLRTDLPLARRVLVEMTPTIILTPVLDILAGTIVESRLERFVAFPGLLVLVPPFVADAGSLGGILSSRLSSKLQLGVISPRGRPEGPALLDGSLTSAFGVVAFALVGSLGLAFSILAGQDHPGAGVMIGGTLIAGLMATAIAVFCGYYIAVLTTRFRLDPDNHSVPVITSVMDLAGTICFLSVLTLLGVATHG